MTRDHVFSLYQNLVNDSDFDRLELGLDSLNIFNVLCIETNELRHSNMLAWLLNPKGNHNLGSKVLKRFLRQIFSSPLQPGLSPVDAEAMDFNSVQIEREWKHIDILIIASDVVIAIENKVFSKEHSNQLQRYREVIEKHFPSHKHAYVFLTPNGESPETETDFYEPLSYEFIADLITRILETYGESVDDRTKLYLKDYVQTVRRDIMKDDEMTALAKQIYTNHKKIIDFIVNNRPDELSRLRDILSEKVLSRGWSLASPSPSFVRFIPTNVLPLIYRNQEVKNGWKNSESFLFEIRLSDKVNKLVFKSVIGPTDPSYDDEKFESILLKIPGSSISKGKQWRVNFTEHFSFDFENLPEFTDDEVSEQVDLLLDKISPIISLVEKQLLEDKDICLELQNEANRNL